MSDLDAAILKELLSSDSEYVSGEAIATKLDISRVSIWGRLEKLKKEGFEFEAVRNKGYRILEKPDFLHPHLLDAYLLHKKVTVPVSYFKTIDSTNSEAERQLAEGCDAPRVIVSNTQQKGRGRMGRAWCSDNDKNLYMSFIFRPNLVPDKMKKFTLWIGISFCHFINEKYNIPAMVKWPNDIICEGRKLAGMLTEARIDSDHTRDLIFGLGLNVNASSEQWPEELKDIAVSLAQLSGRTWNMCELTADIIDTVIRAYEEFISGSYEKDFMDQWKNYDYLFGKAVTGDSHGNIVQGEAAGINQDGAFILKNEKGEDQVFQAGDISCKLC